MNSSSLRLRRITAALAVCWAAAAIVLSLAPLRSPEARLSHPFVAARLAGSVVVSNVSEQASAAGVRDGDQLLAVNGDSVARVARRGIGWLSPDVANEYLLERPDGERYIAELVPADDLAVFNKALGFVRSEKRAARNPP